MNRSLHTAVFAALAACACSTSNGTPMPDVADASPTVYNPPPVIPGAVRLSAPPVTIRAGEEALLCAYTGSMLAQDMDIKEIHGYQGVGGHHVAVFMNAGDPQPAGTIHPCTDEEMSNWRFVGGGAEGAELAFTLPPHVSVTVPARTQFVLQLHYINLEGTDEIVNDAADLVPAEPGYTQAHADTMVINDSDFDIPAHARYSRIVTCGIDQDFNILTAMGHAHRWSTHFHMDIVHANGAVDLLYDSPGGPNFAFHAPMLRYPLENPLALHRGDSVRMQCDWFNTTDAHITFPVEMCSALFYYTPGSGFRSCNVTHVDTIGQGDAGVPDPGQHGCPTPAMPSDPCVRPCDLGNALGVGRYCTAGGRQCNGNGSAIICTQDVDPTAVGFCTKGCIDDSGCGAGAVCVHDTQGSGCVPAACTAGGGPMDGGTSTDASTMDAATGG